VYIIIKFLTTHVYIFSKLKDMYLYRIKNVHMSKLICNNNNTLIKVRTKILFDKLYKDYYLFNKNIIDTVYAY